MPSRIASGPIGDSARWKSILAADPSIVEAGLRLLEVDLDAGRGGPIDLLAVDRAGQLTILHLAAGDPDDALPRVLDQYIWAMERFDLLSRIHASQGLSTEAIIRPLLVARSFSHSFLRRLEMLSVEVTPYLLQAGRFQGNEVVTVRPAVEVFGLPGRRIPSLRAPLAAAPARQAAPEDTVRPIPPAMAPSAVTRSRVATPPLETTGDLLEEMPDPDLLPVVPAGAGGLFESEPLDVTSLSGAGFPGSVPELIPGVGDHSGRRRPSSPGEITATAVVLDDFIEPLSPDELEEFVQFDRSRREREGRSS